MSTYGVIDNLTYTYNGNQLTKVTDAANGPNYTGAFHFVDGSNATTEYEYDQNGNMTKDLNKKISRIQYNLLNLPSTIKIMNATGTYFINKTYDATGQLLRVRYQFGTAGTGPLGSIGDSFPDGGNEPQGGGLVGPIQPPVFDDGRKDYCGNIIYENNALSQILFDGGYITLSGTTPTYHYYLQDYLGNNRVVVKQDGTVEQVNHYYPFGSIIPDICSDQDIQPYKYNGKELDLMHGLNTYDYGARQYNPVTAHWDRVDPLCEKYYSMSPYNYCGNNPIKFIDPNGKDNINFLEKEDRDKTDYSQYENNTPGVINVWAHGVKENKYSEYASYLRVITYVDGNKIIKDINNADDFARYVLSQSREWEKCKGENITIVLHSCSSSQLAKELSGSDIFTGKNITFVAPNNTLHTDVYKNGGKNTYIFDKLYFHQDNNGNLNPQSYKTEIGQWNVYRDGKFVKKYNKHAQPGRLNFKF